MGLFNIFKKKKVELTEEQLKWNKMWDLWVDGKVDSPFAELMEYQSQVNNGGHSQYFTNIENTGDIQKDMSAIETILSKQLNANLKKAYKAYLILEEKEEDEKAEEVLEQCDDVFYELEEEINHAEREIEAFNPEDYYEIDLLFYHIPSHSYVVIELKTTKFKPEYIGQLLFYTNYIDSYVKSDLDSNTIGIVLCPEANGFVCKTTLMNTNNLAISKYKFINELPEYLEKRLKEVDE